MISLRLKSLTKYLNKNDIIMDIGCDHALLDVYLIKNNIVKKAYASDINPKALNSGKENICKYNLEDQIELILASGIKVLPNDVNVLLLAGMGSHTIIKILETEKLKSINKIIVQANNHHYYLRKKMLKKGFIIQNEEVVFCKNKYFVNIAFIPGKKSYTIDELMFGPILMRNSTNKNYFNYLAQEYQIILKKVPKYYFKKRLLMFIKLKKLNRLANTI